MTDSYINHSVQVASCALAPASHTPAPSPGLAGAQIQRKRAVPVEQGPVRIPVTRFSVRTFHAPDSRRAMHKSDETTIDKIITISMPFVKFGTSAKPARVIEI